MTLCFIFCKPWTKSVLFQCTRLGQTITAVNVIYYCRKGFLENTCTVKERMNTVSAMSILGGVVFLVFFYWSETDNEIQKQGNNFISEPFLYKRQIHTNVCITSHTSEKINYMYINSCVGNDTKGDEGVAEYNFYLNFLSFVSWVKTFKFNISYENFLTARHLFF